MLFQRIRGTLVDIHQDFTLHNPYNHQETGIENILVLNKRNDSMAKISASTDSRNSLKLMSVNHTTSYNVKKNSWNFFFGRT